MTTLPCLTFVLPGDLFDTRNSSSSLALVFRLFAWRILLFRLLAWRVFFSFLSSFRVFVSFAISFFFV